MQKVYYFPRMVRYWSGLEIDDWRKHRLSENTIIWYPVSTGLCFSTYGGQSSTQRVDSLSKVLHIAFYFPVIYISGYFGALGWLERRRFRSLENGLGCTHASTKAHTPVQLAVVSRGRYKILHCQACVLQYILDNEESYSLVD